MIGATLCSGIGAPELAGSKLEPAMTKSPSILNGIGATLSIGAPEAVESDGDKDSTESGGRPESHAAIFMPGFRPGHALWRGACGYKTLRGKKQGPTFGGFPTLPPPGWPWKALLTARVNATERA